MCSGFCLFTGVLESQDELNLTDKSHTEIVKCCYIGHLLCPPFVMSKLAGYSFLFLPQSTELISLGSWSRPNHPDNPQSQYSGGTNKQ